MSPPGGAISSQALPVLPPSGPVQGPCRPTAYREPVSPPGPWPVLLHPGEAFLCPLAHLAPLLARLAGTDPLAGPVSPPLVAM